MSDRHEKDHEEAGSAQLSSPCNAVLGDPLSIRLLPVGAVSISSDKAGTRIRRPTLRLLPVSSVLLK
jgi:hypothetical protein